MRIFLIAAAAAVAGGFAFAASRLVDGMAQAPFLFAATALGVLAAVAGAVGVIIAWHDRRRSPGSIEGRVRSNLGLRGRTPLCTECRQPMTQLGVYLVCAGCDQILVGR